jgi:hypothetical protein
MVRAMTEHNKMSVINIFAHDFTGGTLVGGWCRVFKQLPQVSYGSINITGPFEIYLTKM